MSEQANSGSVKWSALIVDGKTVTLVGPRGYKIGIVTCVTADNAQWLVKQLEAWSKQERSDREFENLCQAQ
jgi:predicted metal-dependent hydrolase